jgi:hypothetical protein
MLMQRIIPAVVWLMCSCAAVIRAAEAPKVIPLVEEQRVPKRQTVTLVFDLPEAPPVGRQIRLSFLARVQYPACANNPALFAAVNGKPVVGDDLLNKPLDYEDKNGRDVFWAVASGSRWYLYSWRDFSLDRVWACSSPYAVARGVDPFAFVLDITRYVKAGHNAVSFTHNEIVADLDHYLVLRNVRIETGKAIRSRAGTVATPAPTGPLPTFVPRGPQRVPMTVELADGGAIRLQVGQRQFVLSTRTSEPQGKWIETREDLWRPVAVQGNATAEWTGQGYHVTRTVTLHDDHVHVADTFANTGERLAGVMVEHRLKFRDRPVEVRLAGLPPYAAFHSEAGGTNPTAVARWPDLAVGLVAVDDIFRTHALEFARDDAIGLADHELGIGPGQSHTLQWSIYPVPRGDYWDFINAVRRNWGANFTIPGPQVFVGWSSDTGHRDEAFYRDWIAARGVKLVASYDAMFDDGRAAMGTAIPLAKRFCARTKDWIRELHKTAPGVQALVYMNATLCTEAGAIDKYADSRTLDANGKQRTLAAGTPKGITAAPNFICTLDNSYGTTMMKVCRYLVEDLHADGLYHDVFNGSYSYGARAFGAAWDGCTVVIDPKTHGITGTASRIVLLQQPWEVALVKYLRDRGKMFMANGPIETRTLLNLRIPAFVESILSFSNLYRTHLGAPWGYGNHPVPDPKRGLYSGYAFLARRMLDYGGILAVPSWNQKPTGLTFIHLLYPITPMELRAGMVFAQERILTNRSGLYGWPDDSAADVYVVDADGLFVPSPQVHEIMNSGHRRYEVRMPSDHFAILVRRK